MEWGSRSWRSLGVVLTSHPPAKPSDNHKVSPQTFENHMVCSGTLTCTPENNMVALGTLCTPRNHTDEQLRRHLMRCTLWPQGTIVIECSWQGRLETVYKNRFTLFATPSFPSGIWFDQKLIGQKLFHVFSIHFWFVVDKKQINTKYISRFAKKNLPLIFQKFLNSWRHKERGAFKQLKMAKVENLANPIVKRMCYRSHPGPTPDSNQ